MFLYQNRRVSCQSMHGKAHTIFGPHEPISSENWWQYANSAIPRNGESWEMGGGDVVVVVTSAGPSETIDSLNLIVLPTRLVGLHNLKCSANARQPSAAAGPVCHMHRVHLPACRGITSTPAGKRRLAIGQSWPAYQAARI